MRELFHYALVMLIVESGKATIVERHTMDGREYLMIQMAVRDIFTVVKPQASSVNIHKRGDLPT